MGIGKGCTHWQRTSTGHLLTLDVERLTLSIEGDRATVQTIPRSEIEHCCGVWHTRCCEAITETTYRVERDVSAWGR